MIIHTHCERSERHQFHTLRAKRAPSAPHIASEASTIIYLMDTVAPLAAAVVAGLAARLAVWGPLGGSDSSHADKEYVFLGPARARQP